MWVAKLSALDTHIVSSVEPAELCIKDPYANMAVYSGKKAVIVGGIHGIGLATAKLLVENGAKVMLTGRRSGPVQDAKEDLRNTSAVVLQSDITPMSEISQLVLVTKE